jgi:hypothetical protein
MPNQTFTTVAHKELIASAEGQALVAVAKASAVNILLDIKSELTRNDLIVEMAQESLFDAVIEASSLDIRLSGRQHSISSRYPQMSEETVLQVLVDTQKEIENRLISAAITRDKAWTEEYLPAATKLEVMDVHMQDVVGVYDTPDEVEEWGWVEQKACYNHHKNGQDGIWEFIVNLSSNLADMPARLKPVFKEAQNTGATYIVFHQGT